MSAYPTGQVMIKDLSIAIGQREILEHAQFQLQVGKHYVLVGRNGVGKSTLLQAMATDQIPSIPQSLRILLLGQTQSNLEDSMSDLKLSDTTVLDFVVRIDRKRETLLAEERALTTAIEETGKPTAAILAYRKVHHERLGRRTEESRKMASRRSGARGMKARKILNGLEEELKESADRLTLLESGIDAVSLGHETQQASDLLAEIQASLELMGSFSAEAKAKSVLVGLGFSEESIEQPMSRLSGGWRTRCSLACALSQTADLLLLDEPTNFLDLPSIIWLEHYIQDLPATVTVLVVTHDRAFADGVGEELLVMRNHTLERFRGNISAYEIERAKNYKYLSRMKEAQDKQKKLIEATIDKSVKAAKRAGDDKKLKQAASRKKKLDERWGMEVSAKGGRFKLNRDLPGYHKTNRDAIEVPEFDPPVRFSIPTTPVDLRFPRALLSMEKVCFAYPKNRKAPVLQDVDLTIHQGERVGIAGRNGAGKSTLVSSAMGGPDQTPSSIKPTSGTVSRHTRARIGLYSQHSVEELNSIAAEKPELTALSHLMDFARAEMAEKDARGLLSGLGLVGRTASDVPIALLSGGQKVRLALAKLLWTPPHLLILDEVTTHLDSDAIQALVLALRDYEGAIMVVTHDRFFMRCVVEGESANSIARSYRPGDDDDDEESSEDAEESTRLRTVYRLTKGRLKKLEGGMMQYEELAAKASMKMGKT
ncbi:uncharacterized protein LTR77_006104 [Saxophila tyrrhenica]|uniref:ABC transporter domain-containing protein n=1 Tax=Saxophila tyrrhenica TaxID=1690608 RepID=A0AAV9P7M8_9PEZI|nr:hypothetical protein LTR77_006104 [Saxophila tyrrhenica]